MARGWTLADLFVLTKVRVNTLVVATTAGGYYMAGPSGLGPMELVATCAGTALVASGAAAINQVTERETDRLMERTRTRPLAEGRMHAREGRSIAGLLSALGLAVLWIGAGLAPALVALVTLVTYALVYTPMKRHTSLATVVGAVPGALPPLIGWAAVRGSLAEPAPWALFLIMFLWQLPHFLAIAWRYRDDYARAGLPMLPVVDPGGALTGRQAAVWSATLLPVSLVPYMLGLTDRVYAAGAVVLGLMLTAAAVRFAMRRSDANARMLFYASLTYLPLLWVLMVAGRP